MTEDRRQSGAAGGRGRQNDAPRKKERERIVGEVQGVFMISIAAELAGMHPQTLRVYEARGLIRPVRSPKGTRLYSQKDIESLHRIQELTSEFGMNLAGVERVLALEQTMESMRDQLEQMRERADELQREMLERIEQVRRSYRRELVPWEPPGQMLRAKDAKPVKIPVERKGRGTS